MTNSLKISIQLVAVLFIMALLASCEVSAEDHEDKRLRVAKHSATCYILGREMKLPHYELKIFMDRIGKYNGHPLVTYAVGYTDGMLDAYGTSNTPHFGSFAAARLNAATSLYKLFGCSSAQET